MASHYECEHVKQAKMPANSDPVAVFQPRVSSYPCSECQRQVVRGSHVTAPESSSQPSTVMPLPNLEDSLQHKTYQLTIPKPERTSAFNYGEGLQHINPHQGIMAKFDFLPMESQCGLSCSSLGLASNVRLVGTGKIWMLQAHLFQSVTRSPCTLFHDYHLITDDITKQ